MRLALAAWAMVTVLAAVPAVAAEKKGAARTGADAPGQKAQATPDARATDDGTGDGIDPLLAIGGIVATAFISPLITGAVQRRADRQRFQQERKAAQQDDVRKLLDDAAALLAPAATNLRDLAEQGEEAGGRLSTWMKETFSMGQRLRLRLPADHAVVVAYDAVLEALTGLAKVPIDGEGYRDALTSFEAGRATFLDKARVELETTVAKKEKN